jgi:predicted nucleic acid-binding protein
VSVFVDTSVLVYAYSTNDPNKAEIAREVLRISGGWISTQVLSEFSNVALRKLVMPPREIAEAVRQLAETRRVLTVQIGHVVAALELSRRYRYSYYDSLIIASALAAGATTLYTEDLHHGQTIDGILRIASPFRPEAKQARGVYRAVRSARSVSVLTPRLAVRRGRTRLSEK